MEPSEGKLKSLTLDEKMKLISIVESGRAVKEVAEEFGVNRNTLHYILKNRDKIRENVTLKPGISGFKRIKQTKSPELEMRILKFMHESRKKGEKLSGTIIKSVALSIAAELDVDNFSASNGWLFSFFKRNTITISEFNKGTDQIGFKTRVAPKTINLPTEEIQDDSLNGMVKLEHYTFNKPEQVDQTMEILEVGYEFIDSSGDKYDTEMVDEQEIVEPEVEEHCESPWRSWCRLCGNCETLPVIDEHHSDIVQQLLTIPHDDVRVCDECNAALSEISRMVAKGRVVEDMLVMLQEREKNETISDEELFEVRREFGFELTVKEEEKEELEFLDEEEENSNYEEVVYEDIESLSEVDVIPEDEYDEVIEQEEELIDDNLPDPIQEIVLPEPKSIKISPDESEYKYECHLCGEVYDRMCHLSNHTRTVHHSMPKVACSCGRMLSTWESLMAHKRKHSPVENSFMCELCDTSFRTKTGLSIHVRFKHDKPRKNYQCLSCGRVFKDASILKAHLRTHLPDNEKFAFECEICGKKLVNKWSLKYHIHTIHERVQAHFCHLCGRGFGNKSNLRSHLISHSTENVSCDICGGIFKNRISLQSHKKIHKPDHTKKFSCPTCDKSFHNRNHLNRHIVSHSDLRLFRCPYTDCNNSYKWQKDLKNHMVGVHTGERPHKCYFCDKSFVDAANARRHRLKEHPSELAAFEAQYGKGKRFDEIFHENIEAVETE